jgi:hypothetical protein
VTVGVKGIVRKQDEDSSLLFSVAWQLLPVASSASMSTHFGQDAELIVERTVARRDASMP